jgi:hypothetical protein
VNASYNKDVAADYTIDSIEEFIKDESLREKILKTKIITHRNKLIMIEFAGTLYYIDLDAFNNLILLETKENFVTT